MGSNTIQGYTADPAEVEHLAACIIDDILEGMQDVTDPLARYSALCAEQVRQAAVGRSVVSAIVRLRGAELRAMADGDPCRDVPTMTEQKIADVTGLGTRKRVNQLIAPKTRTTQEMQDYIPRAPAG